MTQWERWRTDVNNDLGRDLVENTFRRIPVGEEFDDLIQPNRSRHGVYRYSSAIDQATHLQKEDFVNFGNI